MVGVTRRYPEPGGRFRKSAFGCPESRAQSSGEWPGARAISLPCFFGLTVSVGGGARPPGAPRFGAGVPRFGSGDRAGRVEEPAACALAMGCCSRGVGRGGGAMSPNVGGAARAAGERTMGGDATTCGAALTSGTDSENDGTGSSRDVAEALGVVCSSSAESRLGALGDAEVSSLTTTDGGGGIASRPVGDPFDEVFVSLAVMVSFRPRLFSRGMPSGCVG